jgi:hypothetical protein
MAATVAPSRSARPKSLRVPHAARAGWARTGNTPAVMLSAAKPRRGMRVVNEVTICHVERVCGTRSVAASVQRNISRWHFMSSGSIRSARPRQESSECHCERVNSQRAPAAGVQRMSLRAGQFAARARGRSPAKQSRAGGCHEMAHPHCTHCVVWSAVQVSAPTPGLAMTPKVLFSGQASRLGSF